jgi:hypothetical protein
MSRQFGSLEFFNVSQQTVKSLVSGGLRALPRHSCSSRAILSPAILNDGRFQSLPDLTLKDLVDSVTSHFNVSADDLTLKSSRHPSRHILALLASQLSRATLREIASVLGLANRDSIHKAIGRAKENTSPEFRRRLLALCRSPELTRLCSDKLTLTTRKKSSCA